MKMKGSRTARVVLVCACALTAFAGLTGVAAAAPTGDDSTQVVLTGGVLSIDAPEVTDFAGVTLEGVATSTVAAIGGIDSKFQVQDMRGTGAGWNVTMQASQFTCSEYTPAKTLALNSQVIAKPTVAAVDPLNASLVPTLAGDETYAGDTGSAVSVGSADVDKGLGLYDFTYADDCLTLSIPADVYAGTYTSTVTLTVATGP